MSMKQSNRQWVLWAACGVLPLLAGCQTEQMRTNPQQAWDRASNVLLLGVQDQNPSTRWMAMEALARTLGARAGEIYQRGLVDPSSGVRASAAMAIGDTQYAPARDLLAAMASSDESVYRERDKRVITAVIYALYRLGDQTHVSELVKLLWDNESEVRAMAAMVMGKMGQPQAIKHLKMLHRDEHDPAVQIQLVESLSLLGDRGAHRLLEAYTKTNFVDEQIVAAEALADIRSPRSKPVLKEMLSSKYPPRVRVAVAGNLGTLGYFDLIAYNLCLDSVRDPRSVLKMALGPRRTITPDHADSLQHLASIALGKIGRESAVDTLVPVMESPESAIRIAAAMSTLQLLADKDGKPKYPPMAPQNAP